MNEWAEREKQTDKQEANQSINKRKKKRKEKDPITTNDNWTTDPLSLYQ